MGVGLVFGRKWPAGAGRLTSALGAGTGCRHVQREADLACDSPCSSQKQLTQARSTVRDSAAASSSTRSTPGRQPGSAACVCAREARRGGSVPAVRLCERSRGAPAGDGCWFQQSRKAGHAASAGGHALARSRQPLGKQRAWLLHLTEVGCGQGLTKQVSA